jgi:hypothetical protein
MAHDQVWLLKLTSGGEPDLKASSSAVPLNDFVFYRSTQRAGTLVHEAFRSIRLSSPVNTRPGPIS